MGRFAGDYLNPIIFINNEYKNSDFIEEKFWKNEQNKWGEIVLNFKHTSFPPSSHYNHSGLSEEILVTTDGLLGMKIHDGMTSDDEVLSVVSHHLNSYMGLMLLGGISLAPFSEKDISHVKHEKNSLEKTSSIGDEYSQGSMYRALCRYEIPQNMQTGSIDFPWVLTKIHKIEEFKKAFVLGSKIIKKCNFKRDSQILLSEFYSNYTLHKWIQSLILGWVFIEIILNKLWEKEITKNIKLDEKGRKDRLNDNKIYTSAVKIELLYSMKIINKQDYNILNEIRTIRNKFVHDGKDISQANANLLFNIIKKLITQLTNETPLFNNPGWTRAGGFGFGFGS